MNRNLIWSMFAGLGIISMIFISYGHTSITTVENNFPELVVGKTYKIEQNNAYNDMTVLEKPNGNWVKARIKNPAKKETTTGYLNLDQVYFIEAE